MENEILLWVDGMDKRCEDEMTREILRMPGIELVQVNAAQGTVSVTGGDLDQLQITDIIESMGYTLLH